MKKKKAALRAAEWKYDEQNGQNNGSVTLPSIYPYERQLSVHSH